MPGTSRVRMAVRAAAPSSAMACVRKRGCVSDMSSGWIEAANRTFGRARTPRHRASQPRRHLARLVVDPSKPIAGQLGLCACLIWTCRLQGGKAAGIAENSPMPKCNLPLTARRSDLDPTTLTHHTLPALHAQRTHRPAIHPNSSHHGRGSLCGFLAGAAPCACFCLHVDMRAPNLNLISRARAIQCLGGQGEWTRRVAATDAAEEGEYVVMLHILPASSASASVDVGGRLAVLGGGASTSICPSFMINGIVSPPPHLSSIYQKQPAWRSPTC